MHSHTVCQLFSTDKKYNFNQVFFITCISSPPTSKKSPASHSSLISVYLRTVLTLEVTIFNKLDPKEHDSRDTEMELTFSQCQDLQRVY